MSFAENNANQKADGDENDYEPDRGKRNVSGVMSRHRKTGVNVVNVLATMLKICATTANLPASQLFTQHNTAHAFTILCYNVICTLEEAKIPTGQNWVGVNQCKVLVADIAVQTFQSSLTNINAGSVQCIQCILYSVCYTRSCG